MQPRPDSSFFAGPAPSRERVLPVLRVLGNQQAFHDGGGLAEAANGIKLRRNFPLLEVYVSLVAASRLTESFGDRRGEFFRIFAASPMFGTDKVFH